MFVKITNAQADRETYINLGLSEAIKRQGTAVELAGSNLGIRAKDEDEAKARIEDIMAAYLSEKIKVYDASQEVGYWEPEPNPKTTHKKSAPAKE